MKRALRRFLADSRLSVGGRITTRRAAQRFRSYSIAPFSPVLAGEGPGVRGPHPQKMHPSPQPLSPEYRGAAEILRVDCIDK